MRFFFQNRKVWTVSVMVKDFSVDGIAVSNVLKRVLRVDKAPVGDVFNDVEYLRSFIPVSHTGDPLDFDEDEDILIHDEVEEEEPTD